MYPQPVLSASELMLKFIQILLLHTLIQWLPSFIDDGIHHQGNTTFAAAKFPYMLSQIFITEIIFVYREALSELHL